MFMFVIPFILILLAIIIIWLVRKTATKLNAARGRPPPAFATTTATTMRGREFVPPTFGNVARNVTDSIFRTPVQGWDYDRYNGRDSTHGAGAGLEGRMSGEGVAVNRQAGASDASLPVYGANTLPVPPETAYEPGRQRYVSSAGGLPLYSEAPPKYTAAVDNRQTAMV